MAIRWEFTTFDLIKPARDVATLNRLGADGWEAVAMVSSWGIGWRMVHPIVLLKRPVTDGSGQAQERALEVSQEGTPV